MRVQLYAAEPNQLLGYLKLLESVSEMDPKLVAQMMGQVPEDDDDIYEEEGDEALIQIEGLLTQAGPSPIARLFGATGCGYREIAEACQRAMASACKSVTFLVSSIGGEVAGMDQCWQAIRALAQAKPCRAINTGIMASAAYELASAVGPGNIFADSPACESGSIGIKAVAWIDGPDGAKEITIVSKNAPLKNDDPATKAGRSVIQDRLDAMERQFIARIAEGRGITAEKVIADYGQGGVLVARDPAGEPDALKAGMIDGIVAPRGLVSMTPPDNFSRRMPGMQMKTGALAAQHTPPKEKPMTLKELLATDASAQAEFNAAMATATKAGADAVTARITAAQPFLALEATDKGYTLAEVKQIQKCAVDVIAGTEDTGALRGFVRMVDMQAEARKLAAAQKETAEHGETPGQITPAGKAALEQKAATLKIDVPAIYASATSANQDPVAVLTAEIEMREAAARQKGA